jgi:hypothetical protein
MIKNAVALGRSGSVALFAVLAPALAIAAVFAWPMVGDYTAYLTMWDQVLAGGDPWAKGLGNNYGPLFNLLAIPAAIDPRAPKLLFALVWAATIATLACRDLWLALALAPLGISQSVSRYGGEFDILVGLCLLAASSNRRAGSDVTSGTWLAIGFLLKFLPLVALPFLALDGRRPRLKLISAAAVLSAGGLIVSAMIWGPRPTLRPLVFAARRPSAWFSGFAFARVMLGIDLDALSGPLTALSLTALAAWFWYRRPDPIPVALAAIGVVLALYKHGGTQYPVMLAVPVAWFAIGNKNRILRLATVLYAGWASAVWMAFPTIWESWPPGPSKELLKVAGGLPVFLLTMFLVAALLHQARATTMSDQGL